MPADSAEAAGIHRLINQAKRKVPVQQENGVWTLSVEIPTQTARRKTAEGFHRQGR